MIDKRTTPVCIKCRCVMRRGLSTVLVQRTVLVRVGGRVWDGDIWLCPECGTEIATPYSAESSNSGVWLIGLRVLDARDPYTEES